MIKINRKVEYALMALKYMISHKGELVTARKICDHFKIPFDTTAKVMQLMNQQGILKSIQGVKGGYEIQADLSQINFRDFAQLIEQKTFGTDCENGQCELVNSCNITGPVKRLNQYVTSFFAGVYLKELLDDHSILSR